MGAPPEPVAESFTATGGQEEHTSKAIRLENVMVFSKPSLAVAKRL